MLRYVPLTRYVKLRVAHVLGMPGTFSSPPWFSDLDMHHGTCVTHVPWCMPGSLTSHFLWSRWWGKCSQYARRMRNPQFYVPGKRPTDKTIHKFLMLPCSITSPNHYAITSVRSSCALRYMVHFVVYCGLCLHMITDCQQCRWHCCEPGVWKGSDSLRFKIPWNIEKSHCLYLVIVQ